MSFSQNPINNNNNTINSAISDAELANAKAAQHNGGSRQSLATGVSRVSLDLTATRAHVAQPPTLIDKLTFAANNNNINSNINNQRNANSNNSTQRHHMHHSTPALVDASALLRSQTVLAMPATNERRKQDSADSTSLPSSAASTSDSMFKRTLSSKKRKWNFLSLFGARNSPTTNYNDQRNDDDDDDDEDYYDDDDNDNDDYYRNTFTNNNNNHRTRNNNNNISDLRNSNSKSNTNSNSNNNSNKRPNKATTTQRRANNNRRPTKAVKQATGRRSTFTRLLTIIAILAIVFCVLVYFKFVSFSAFKCSFGRQSATLGGLYSTQAVFDLNKNGPEYYLGITEMLQAMDNAVDPCTDFYSYACGSWTRRHSIPADESRIDTFSVMRTDLGAKLKDLLEQDIDSSDSAATAKAKTLYKSCINEALIDKRGPQLLIELLDKKFGGWPLLSGSGSGNNDVNSSSNVNVDTNNINNNNSNNSKEDNSNDNNTDNENNSNSTNTNTNESGGELLNSATTTTTTSASNSLTQQPILKQPVDWVQLMAVLRTYNNEIIIGQTVGSHEQNSSMHAIRLYPASLGLPSADYYNSSSRQFKAYEKYILSTLNLLRANNSNLQSDVRELLEFETALANISRPFEKQGGATYHRMTIARLQKYTPAINWQTYFKYSFPDLQINSTEQIGLYGLDFFMDIAQLINQTQAQNKQTVINYLLWRFVMNRVNNLGKIFADNQHEYAAEISGAKSQAPRHKVCVDYVNGNMGMAVSSLYVKKHFDVSSKQQAEIMISNIRQAFVDILTEVDWMDSETRAEAIVKAKSMLQHIGFPMWIIEPKLLDIEYEHLNFSVENYFENVLQLIQSFARDSRAKLRQPSERDKWTVAPSIINAHYLRTKNLMSFPAGILQPPIYHTNYPKSLNYGGIGSIIGHEITHGFDNDGRHHDYQGNQRLWWHPNTIDRFLVRSQCMVKQYDDYSADVRGESVSVSGVRTLGENIADNGGLKEAFIAYKRFEAEHGPEEPLPGLNLTHHQMFFIKFAQNWCQNMTPQSMLNALKTWRHPLGKFRVIGTLSNLNEFATTFNCPVNSSMNPTNKCKVW